MWRFVFEWFGLNCPNLETIIDKNLQFIYNVYTLFRKSEINTAKGKAADGGE